MFIDKEGNVRKPVVYLADFEMFLPSGILEEELRQVRSDRSVPGGRRSGGAG